MHVVGQELSQQRRRPAAGFAIIAGLLSFVIVGVAAGLVVVIRSSTRRLVAEIAIVAIPAPATATEESTRSCAVRARWLRTVRACGGGSGLVDPRLFSFVNIQRCNLHIVVAASSFVVVAIDTVVTIIRRRRRRSVSLEQIRQTRRLVGRRKLGCCCCCCFHRTLLLLLLPRKPLPPFGNPPLNVFGAVADADAKALHAAPPDGHHHGLESVAVVVAAAVIVHHGAVRLNDAGRRGKVALPARRVLAAHVLVQGGGRIELPVVTRSANVEQFFYFL